MRVRYYHVNLETSPSWGQITGFGLEDATIEWSQANNWWQLMLVESGGVVTVNGSTTPFDPGSLIVVPPSARCRLERTEPENRTQFWLWFRPGEEGQRKEAIPHVTSLGADYAYFARQFNTSFDYMHLTRKRLDVMCWHLLWRVAENAAKTPEQPAVAHLEAFIKSDLSRRFTTEMLAETAGISASGLIYLFRDHFGQVPTEYIRSLRMERACVLLTKTPKPIKEIALSLGYSSLQRFNKVVRETFGCAPTTLRLDRRSVDLYQAIAQRNNAGDE